MKIEDLMIGDWVLTIFGADDKLVPVVITDIHNDGVVKTDPLGWRRCNDIYPVSLTKEILEKNAFPPYKYGTYFIESIENDMYFYSKSGYVGVDVGGCDTALFAECKYVHELQHILKVCGIDKEIMV